MVGNTGPFSFNRPRTRRNFRELPGDPLVIPRDQHNISRALIDPDALRVMYRLLHHGYRAFLVGGGVRDLLLGKRPKDFDVGTDATTEEVRRLFRNSRIIGRRFKINHVYFGNNKIIEVATFRAGTEEATDGSTRTLARDNTYGDPQTDALRRDLTINGLFYDLSSFTIVDYVGGLSDLKQGVIRVIGDPKIRFVEDPVRMIRAIRHAARTGFRIEYQTYQDICSCRDLIRSCPTSRVYEEFLRELRGGSALRSFRLMHETKILSNLLPKFAEFPKDYNTPQWRRLEGVLIRIDQFSLQGIELEPGVIFAALFMGNIADREKGDVYTEYGLSGFWEYLTEAETASIIPRAIKSAGEGYLRDFIKLIFAPMGLSRAESENMAGMMIGRLQVFQAMLEDRQADSEKVFSPRKIFSRRGNNLERVVRLLELTGGEDYLSMQCLARLRDESEKNIVESRGRPRRRSRGRNRARKSGSGTAEKKI